MSYNKYNTSLSQPLITSLTLDHGQQGLDGFVKCVTIYGVIVANRIVLPGSNNCGVLHG